MKKGEIGNTNPHER
jgi:hypothetical protein